MIVCCRSAKNMVTNFSCRICLQCTFGKCRALLSNNISYMFHLWAHITNYPLDYSSLNSSRSMRSCPQCLHVFPTPFRSLTHYNNVHVANVSSVTCRICEITVDTVLFMFLLIFLNDSLWYTINCIYLLIN